MESGLVFLEDNIQALSMPSALARQLLEHDAQPRRAITVGRSKSGAPNLAIDGIWIHDQVDPINEAAGHVDSLLSQEQVDLVILFGLGLGYHAEQLERRYDCRILVFEPCFDALRTAFGSRPLALMRTTVVADLSDLANLAVNFLQFNDHRLVVGAIPSYAHLFSQAFESFKEMVNASLHNAKLLENTVEFRVPTWIEHVMTNIPKALRMPGLEDIGDRFAGKPGIVAAAGPSLWRNIDILRSAQGRAVIVGVNTSLPQLEKGQVVPDIVAVVEGLELVSQFDVPFLDQLVIAPALIAHPDFFNLKARHIVPFGDNSATASDWIVRAFGSPPIHTGGSVACSAFSILYCLGCDPIILVGQDLAYTGGARYAPGAKFGTQKIQYDPVSGTVITVERSEALDKIRAAGGLATENRLSGEEVVAYGGAGKVVTTKMFSMFRKWFESSARTWAADRRLINATEGGARIEGFEEMPLAEALSRFATEPVPAKQWLDQSLSEAQRRDPRRLAAVIEEDMAKCREHLARATEARHRAEAAKRRIEQSGFALAAQELEALREAEKELGKASKGFHALDHYVAAEVNALRRARFEDEAPSADEQALKSLDRSKALFEAVERGALALLNRMQRVVQTINENSGHMSVEGETR